MKKIATFFIICLTSINLLQAQTTGGPDTYGYIWRDSNDPQGPAYNWIDILPLTGASNVRFLGDDNTVGPFNIGFPFHFYWYDVSQFWVGSNGYISFANGQLSSPFPVIPATAAPQNYLAAMMSDLIFGSPGDTAQCWHWTNAANDTLIVSYINVPFWLAGTPNYSGDNTFQIILSARDSSITYQYKTQVGTSNGTAINFAGIGIENNSGNIGLQHSHDVLPPTNYAIKFYYPTNNTYQVTDVSTTYNNNPETGGLFLCNHGHPFTMNTSIKNTGNQNTSAFNVFSRVLNSVGAIQVQSTLMSNALTPGQSQNITFPATFSPTTAGTYTYVNNTQLASDATPSNDQKVQELQVVDTTAATIRLSFDNGVDAGLGGLNWNGGNGGAGVYFIPPFYPCNIKQLHAYITANAAAAGFSLAVYADDGIAGAPGSLLDSEYVASGNVTTLAWNDATLSTPLRINSGAIYVAWIMDGTGIGLGQNQVAPFSNRTYEIQGTTWATYRARETEDLMINITIEKVPGLGVNEVALDNYFGNFYPNPTSSYSYLNYDLSGIAKKLSYEVYNVQGQLILRNELDKQISGGKLIINTEVLNAGIYTCKITIDGNNIIRKLMVMK